MSAPLTAEWLDHLERDRRYSPNTIATYRRTMGTIPGAATATRADVEAWWATRTHLAPRTRANELAALRSFYRWAITWDHRPDDPTIRLTAPKAGHTLPAPMSRADLHRILERTPPDLTRAIHLGAYAGLRVAEAAALDWSDVDAERWRLYVRAGKGAKDRAVGVSPLLLDALLPDTGGNVVCGGGAAYTAQQLQRRVNRAIRAAGVDGTFHKLRARYATVALAATGNLLAVSRALGHSSPTTTALYAAAVDNDLDVIAAAAAR